MRIHLYCVLRDFCEFLLLRVGRFCFDYIKILLFEVVHYFDKTMVVVLMRRDSMELHSLSDGKTVVIDTGLMEPETLVLDNRPLWISLLATTVCGVFTQYQPVGACVFAFHGLYLIFLYLTKGRWKFQLFGSILVSSGMMFSMSQLFRIDDWIPWDWYSVGIVLGLEAAIVFLFWICAQMHLILFFGGSGPPPRFYLFCQPVLLATLYSLLADYSPLGSQASLGYGLHEWLPFIQIVSVFGLTGLNFVILCISTLLAHYWIEKSSRTTPAVQLLLPDSPGGQNAEFSSPRVPQWKSRSKFCMRVSLGLFFSVWIFGAFRILSPYIYQRGVGLTALSPKDWVRVACVLWPDEVNPLTSTRIILSTGVPRPEMVLWSETAGGSFYNYGDSVPQYSSFASEIAEMASTYNATIGATYTLWSERDPSKRYNLFSFWDETGLIFDYAKRHPVPIMEDFIIMGNNTEMGSGTSTNIGTFDAAICFDFDYPEYVRKSTNSGLLIQTANTWGIVGYFHGIDSSFRAIENGAYLARCGARGPSGVWDPYGSILSYQARNGTDIVYFDVPRDPKQVWTFYSKIGFVFDYCIYAIAGIYIILILRRYYICKRTTN